MNSLIREKRKFVFSKKRLTPAIIRSLATVIQLEAESESNGFVMYALDAADASSYESASTVIFKENELLDRKVIEKIIMRFNTPDYSKSIEVQIVHTQEENKDSYVSVGGSDTTWVNGIIGRMTEILESAEQQPHHTKLLGWMAAILCIFFWYFSYLILIEMKKLQGPNWMYSLGFLAWLIVPPVTASKLHERLVSLWPAVELQTGYHYQQEPAKKRTEMAWILAAMILPVVTAGIYDFVKFILLS